ncbi:hypothetical protein BDZ85DRAFT_239454 [Elsinoe ampelina]|uniref:Tim17/Tim22/Tim23/Pmp24 family-domain-containing protein n=1 Tax=Elsinoe ampelina TaxID=302913 RepID=A0A6A6G665_9PEZI|nr:hypothetical protein BDZ85DRAFT_239454 [Elsinoe ampelina]
MSGTRTASTTGETSNTPSVQQRATIFSRSEHDRLSLPFPARLSLSFICSSFTGLGLGSYYGAQSAGLRFRAENAHRLPTSEVGWFLYHKSKNYHAMLGGVKEGIRMGAKLGIWGGLFFWMEEVWVQRDFLSTTVAALGTAGAFSAWNRFSLPTAARAARMGLKVGLAFGLLQDFLGYFRGRRLGYVEFIKRRFSRSRDRQGLTTI